MSIDWQQKVNVAGGVNLTVFRYGINTYGLGVYGRGIGQEEFEARPHDWQSFQGGADFLEKSASDWQSPTEVRHFEKTKVS